MSGKISSEVVFRKGGDDLEGNMPRHRGRYEIVFLKIGTDEDHVLF